MVGDKQVSDDYDENIEYMFGVMDERKRIIKVLNTAKGTDCGCKDCKGVHNYIDALIELIKGENK
jgi:hypothetical protein